MDRSVLDSLHNFETKALLLTEDSNVFEINSPERKKLDEEVSGAFSL